ncbi:hypothetical protein Tco_1563068 [Tanacetum coccineum]
MACSLPHTDSEVEALVQRLINEDKGRQDALLELAFRFEDSCAVRDDLRKAYEKCTDISQESRALICTFLKESSGNDHKLHLSMYGKASRLEKHMGANWLGFKKSYSQNSKAYIILNKHTRKIEDSLNVTFDETPPPSKTSPLVDDDLDEEEAIRETKKKNLENVVEDETLEIDEIVNIKESMNHPLENVIENLNKKTLRSQAQNQSNFFCFISTIEPKNVNEALGDESWIVAMQEELNQFIANDVWELVPQPKNMTIIGTKWVFRNKLDENGVVSRNKGREGDYVDRKSTGSICTFVGCCLTSLFSKKQTALAISTTEAEYVSARKTCQQALWMKQALIDYDVRLDDVPIMCDNKGAIDLSKNPVQHSRTKHIEIRYHFPRDNVQKGHISIEKVPSVDNISDILTKPLKRESFNYLRLGLGMMEHIL